MTRTATLTAPAQASAPATASETPDVSPMLAVAEQRDSRIREMIASTASNYRDVFALVFAWGHNSIRTRVSELSEGASAKVRGALLAVVDGVAVSLASIGEHTGAHGATSDADVYDRSIKAGALPTKAWPVPGRPISETVKIPTAQVRLGKESDGSAIPNSHYLHTFTEDEMNQAARDRFAVKDSAKLIATMLTPEQAGAALELALLDVVMGEPFNSATYDGIIERFASSVDDVLYLAATAR